MRTYRVEYQAGAQQGSMLVRTPLTDAGGVATQAAAVLRDRGIDPQIRRVVGLTD